MYVVLEYLTYVALAGVLGAVLFGASATVLVTHEGAKRAAQVSRQLADRGGQVLSRYLSALSTLQGHNSHESQ